MAESALVGVLRVLLTANTAEYTTGLKAAETSTKKFEQAVSDAKSKLQPLELSSRGVAEQLKRLTTAFDGSKLIRDARLMAEAVDGLKDKSTGAFRLTTAELEKVSKKLEEAREKARLMGHELPDSFHKTADAIKAQLPHLDKAAEKTTLWGNALGSVKTLAIGFVAGFSVQRIVSEFVQAFQATLALGDQLSNLAAQSGMSVEQLQKLRYAGASAGVAIETLSAATAELGRRLIDGDKGAVAAMKRLGISVADFNAMQPDEQILALNKALLQVESTTERNALGYELMGKKWQSIAPAMAQDLEELGKQAENLGVILDKETVAAIDSLGDKLDQAAIAGEGFMARFMTPFVEAINNLAAKLDGVVVNIGDLGETLGRLALSGGSILNPANWKAAWDDTQAAKISRAAKSWTELGDSMKSAMHSTAGLTLGARENTEEQKKLAAAAARAAAEAQKSLEASAKAWAAWNAQLRNQTNWGVKDIGITYGWAEWARKSLTPAPTFNISNLGTNPLPWGGVGMLPGMLPGGSSSWVPQGVSPWANWATGALGLAGPWISGAVSNGSRAAGIGGSIGSFGASALSTMWGLGGGALTGLGTAMSIGLPVIGPLIGSALGPIISKLFGPSEGRLASQARGQWIAGMGGGEAFNQRFRQSQVSPEEARRLTMNLMSAKSRKEVEQAQAAIEAALARNNALLQQQEQIESQIADVESERQRIIDSLKVGYADVLSIAQKYGISVEGLGKTINQLGTTASFTTILNDLEALNRAAQAAGGELDWGGALAGMKEEINALVQQAIAAGTALPENMRPYLQSLADAGELLDANGQKISDLSTLNWGPAVETDAQKANTALEKIDQTLSDLNATLKDIAAALRGDLPSAAQAGATGIENAINGIDPNPIVVRVNYDDPGYEPREGGAQTYGARGGLVTAAGIQYRQLGGQIVELANRWRPRGTDTVPAMLTPGELVLTLEQQRGLASVLGASGITPDSQGRAGMAGVTEQTVVVVQGGGSKEDLLERIMAALPRKTRTNDRGFRTLMRDALGVA